jgi:hypothetical protein
MNANEKDFTSPVFDFFPPRKGYHEFGISRVGDCGIKDINHMAVYYGSSGKSRLYDKDIINSISPNDLNGITISFSGGVKYIGNFTGGHVLYISLHAICDADGKITKQPFFSNEHIARVRKPSGEVVWENIDVPRRKRLLL